VAAGIERRGWVGEVGKMKCRGRERGEEEEGYDGC
jgi:hypothetical protein